MEIELRQVLRAVIRWGWLIALTTVLAGGLAFALTHVQSATYSATTTLLVNPQQVTSTTDSSALQASRSQADTYVRLVDSGPVIDRVREELNLSLTRDELRKKIDAVTVMNTQLIEITVKDPSAEEAARIANTTAAAFQSQVEDLTTGPLQDNLDQATTESASLQSRVKAIDAELVLLDTEANRDNAEIQQQIEALREERTRAQETIVDLSSTIRSINQALATTTSSVEVADEARAAREPDSPKPLLMTALGLFLGFLVGSGLAAVLEMSDRKVRPETDIEELTGARLLGVVSMDRKSPGTGQPVLRAKPDSIAAEAIRLLRTHLQGFVDAHPNGVLAMAHTGAGAPASDVLASLGVALAQSGTSTLLLDADLRNPVLHDVFGVANDSGIATVTGDGAALGGSVEVAPGLELVTAGIAKGHPAEVVSSAAFMDAVRQLSGTSDFTLVNTPSALAYSDAMSIAALANGVLIVGRYGETSRDDLAALAATIREDGMTLVGVVMIRG